MKNHRSIELSLSRRSFVRNTAMLALLAPVLRRMHAMAAPPVSPRRVILIFSPNGPMKAAGPAFGSESDFTVHDWWQPLARHKADGIFLSHMAPTGAGTVSGDGHGLGGQMYSGFGAEVYAQKGETIDQRIGKRLEAEQRSGLVRSVVWGNLANSRGGGTGDAFASAAARNIPPEMDPSQAWAQLFSKFIAPTSNPEEVKRAAALLARNQSVLDFVATDCASMRDALGAEGMILLDDHCTTVRNIEKNLMTTLAPSCVKPEDPGDKDWANRENCDAQSAAFIELMAASLSCELTHVIAYQFGAQAARNQIAAKYGVASSPKADSGDSGPAHHPWTHQGESDSKTEAMRLFTSFYASQVALLIDKLKTTQDASGKPLLDSTMVLWASELGGNDKNSGDPHQTGCNPVVLFGAGQGTFKTGRYIHGPGPDTGNGGAGYKAAGQDMAKLLVTLMQYMGLDDVTTIGATGVNGPLTSLLV